ncbi:MAG: DUF302 domain-containing protein [Bryobacteraceae bacterium]
MQTGKTMEYGYVREVGLKFEEAAAGIEAALKTEGFGVLCQIDIQAKLKEKLGVEFPRYLILGACNPPIAYQALQQEINLGLLLPCNAVVYEQGGRIHVGVVDAARMLSVVGNPAMEAMARQVDEKLRRAVDRVAAQAAE